jgi:hypothetical protein
MLVNEIKTAKNKSRKMTSSLGFKDLVICTVTKASFQEIKTETKRNLLAHSKHYSWKFRYLESSVF